MTKFIALFVLAAAVVSAPIAASAITNDGFTKSCKNNTLTPNGVWDCR